MAHGRSPSEQINEYERTCEVADAMRTAAREEREAIADDVRTAVLKERASCAAAADLQAQLERQAGNNNGAATAEIIARSIRFRTELEG
jgi:hypothetical protein